MYILLKISIIVSKGGQACTITIEEMSIIIMKIKTLKIKRVCNADFEFTIAIRLCIQLHDYLVISQFASIMYTWKLGRINSTKSKLDAKEKIFKWEN